MKKDEIRAMLLDVLGEVDYDVAKSYDKDTAEEPDTVDERMNKLIAIAQRHMKKASRTK